MSECLPTFSIAYCSISCVAFRKEIARSPESFAHRRRGWTPNSSIIGEHFPCIFDIEDHANLFAAAIYDVFLRLRVEFHIQNKFTLSGHGETSSSM